MTEIINFPDGTVQHAYITTDNANDDLQVAVLDGDYVLLDTNESAVARWDASETEWNWEGQDHTGIASAAIDQADLTSTTGSNTNEIRTHDGTGVLPAGVACRWDGSNWRVLEAVSFSYTGDGTTGRTLAADFAFERVTVEEGGGTAVDAYAGGLSNGALSGNSFAGELTVESTGGFTVGDNGADADPNTDTETYQVIAE